MLKRIILFLGFALPAFAQAPDTMWTRSVGFIINSIAETPEHNIAVLGDSVLLLLDPNGDSLGSISYGGLSFDITNDSGFIIAGDSLVKIYPSGYFAWSKPVKSDFVITCKDSGYLLLNRPDTGRVIRTDDAGNVVWDKTYPHGIQQIRQTADHGFISTGLYENSDKGVLLMKTDGAGDTLWTRSFDDSIGYEIGRSVQVIPDGNFIVFGDIGPLEIIHNNLRFFIIKTDSFGNIILFKKWIGISSGPGGYMYIKIYASHINLTHDMQLITIGDYNVDGWYTDWNGSWIFKNDSLLNQFWYKELPRVHKHYSSGRNLIFEHNHDSGILASHNGDAYGTIIKLQPEIVKISKPKETPLYKCNLLLTNPVKNMLHLELDIYITGQLNVSLFDINGKFVGNIFKGSKPAGKHFFEYCVMNMPPGIYFLQFSQYHIQKYYKLIIMN